MANKTKYVGEFNYRREMIILYCSAYSKAQAREIFFRRLSNIHEVSIATVRSYFDGSKDNFTIEED